MSKNQKSLKAYGRFRFWNFFVILNSKRSLLLDSLFDGGRGRIRTCDPALIKRML